MDNAQQIKAGKIGAIKEAMQLTFQTLEAITKRKNELEVRMQNLSITYNQLGKIYEELKG